MSEWRDRVRVIHIEQSVNTAALREYRDRGYEDAIRAQAGRALGDRLLRECAVEQAVEEASDDDYLGRTAYKYDVAVVMPEGGRSHFAEQLAEERRKARRDALDEAVAFVREQARIMREIGEGLIAFNLDEVASGLARHAKTPTA